MLQVDNTNKKSKRNRNVFLLDAEIGELVAQLCACEGGVKAIVSGVLSNPATHK
jgi:hypothetical protein